MVTTRVLSVVGSVSYDYLIYPMSLADSNSLSESVDKGELAQLVIRTGDADLVAQLLTAAAPKWDLEVFGPPLQPPASNSLKQNASTVVDLTCDRTSLQRPSRFDVLQIRQIGKRPAWHAPPIAKVTATSGSTVIITGAGEAFQDVEPALDFLQKVKPKYIIHHATRPLATGRLWDIIRNGPMVSTGVPDPDNLAVIIDAEDLRAEGIPLSRSLSWEATAEDFVRNLGSNGRLDTLVTCPNLIVRFGNEGVIHHRGRDAVNPKLYFQSRQMEQPHTQMLGAASAFTAGFALKFPDCEAGIKLGITAANRLSRTGFVPNKEDDAPDYDINTIMENLSLEDRVSTVSVPSTKISKGDSFSMFETLTGDVSEIARQIVTLGPERALAHCSVRKFGRLQTADRIEQESLASIVDTMHERLASENPSPTCIGVFGPVGSGKKFAATALSDTVSEKWPLRKLTYDTSVMDLEKLKSICNTVRDNAAENYLTVVSFENFESLFKDKKPLLNEFTSLMRYGRFRDGAHDRVLGRCLLLFSLNQEPPRFESTPTPTHAEFNINRAVDDASLRGNLHGRVTLLGPNQAGPQDKLYSVRRAFMLRQLLKERHPHLEVNGTIKIDDAVLYAFLTVPAYREGLHALEKIISTSRLSGRAKFDVSALPPEEQIDDHVDGVLFVNYLRSPKLHPVLRERLAQGLFERYKQQRRLMATTAEEKQELIDDSSMADWDELPGVLKESSRGQADDIPRKLRAVGYFMVEGEKDSDAMIHVPEFTKEDLDILDEMEHERFNAERLQQQWRTGQRNSKQRVTPFIKPWRDLQQKWKDVDRVMVEVVPQLLAKQGYRIYKMKSME